MGLTEVIGEVRRDGEGRAEKLLSDAQAEADRILAAAKAKAEEYESQRLAQAERDAEQARAQILSHAEFEARKHTLATEAELRDDLRQQVLDAFGDLPAKTRQKHIDALLKTAKDTLGGGTLWGAKQDTDALKGAKGFEYGGEADIIGGIIVESADGKNRLDLSYETLLGDMWRDILRQEAGLFS